MSRGEFSSPPASTRLSVLKMIQTGSCLLSSASRLAASMMVGVDGFAPQVHGVVNHGEGKIIDPVLEAPGENATANVHAVFCCAPCITSRPQYCRPEATQQAASIIPVDLPDSGAPYHADCSWRPRNPSIRQILRFASSVMSRARTYA
jgi:hypothetical protein